MHRSPVRITYNGPHPSAWNLTFALPYFVTLQEAASLTGKHRGAKYAKFGTLRTLPTVSAVGGSELGLEGVTKGARTGSEAREDPAAWAELPSAKRLSTSVAAIAGANSRMPMLAGGGGSHIPQSRSESDGSAIRSAGIMPHPNLVRPGGQDNRNRGQVSRPSADGRVTQDLTSGSRPLLAGLPMPLSPGPELHEAANVL